MNKLLIITMPILLFGCATTRPSKDFISEESWNVIYIKNYDLKYSLDERYKSYPFSTLGKLKESDGSMSVVYGWLSASPILDQKDMWIKIKEDGQLCFQNEKIEDCTSNYDVVYSYRNALEEHEKRTVIGNSDVATKCKLLGKKTICKTYFKDSKTIKSTIEY